MARPKWPPRRQDCHSFPFCPFCPDATSTAEGNQFHAVLPDKCSLLLQPVYQNRLTPRLQQLELVQEQIEAGARGKGKQSASVETLGSMESRRCLYFFIIPLPFPVFLHLPVEAANAVDYRRTGEASILFTSRCGKRGKMILERDPKAWIICAHVRFEKWPGAAGCISGQKCLYSPLQVMTAKIGQ